MKYKEFIKILNNHGYFLKRCSGGSHEVWYNNNVNITIVVPHRNGYDINKMVCRNILKKIGAVYKNV